MVDVVYYFFEEEVVKFLKNKPTSKKAKGQKFLSKKQIKTTLKDIDEEISSSIMRAKIMSAIIEANGDEPLQLNMYKDKYGL